MQHILGQYLCKDVNLHCVKNYYCWNVRTNVHYEELGPILRSNFAHNVSAMMIPLYVIIIFRTSPQARAKFLRVALTSYIRTWTILDTILMLIHITEVLIILLTYIWPLPTSLSIIKACNKNSCHTHVSTALFGSYISLLSGYHTSRFSWTSSFSGIRAVSAGIF